MNVFVIAGMMEIELKSKNDFKPITKIK